MCSPRLPSYKACSAVLNTLELLNHILRLLEEQRVTVVQSTSNISMNENLCTLRSQIHSNLCNIPKMKYNPNMKYNPSNPTRNLRSAGKHLLEVPNVRLKSYGSRAFSVAAPKY